MTRTSAVGSPTGAATPRRVGLVFAGPTLLGLAAVWSLAAWWWPTLPSLIPLHFDGSGMPTRWGPSSVANWFLIPFIATWTLGLLAVITFALPALARRYPEFVNLPGRLKAIWRTLPAERRVRTLAPVQWLLAIIGIGTSVLFIGILWQTLSIALEVATNPDAVPTPRLGSGWILGFTGLVVVSAIVSVMRVRTLVLGERLDPAPEA